MDSASVFRVAVVGLAVLVAGVLIAPYLTPVLAALLIAYVLRPVYRRLAPRVGDRVAALGLIVAFTLFLLLPFLLLASALVDGIREILAVVREESLVPDGGEAVYGELFGGELTLERFLTDSAGSIDAGTLLRSALALFGGFTDAVLVLTVLAFVLYFALVDGPDLLEWVRAQTPLPDDQWRELTERADALTFGAVVGEVAVAVIQGLLAGIAFFLLGLPGVLFWALVTTILGFLPVVGPSFVYVPTSIYLLAVGRPLAGVAFLLYGAVVVSVSDDYLRPLIGGQAGRLNPALVVVGIFGGLALFGFVGIFYGPILIGMVKAVFETVWAGDHAGSTESLDDDRGAFADQEEPTGDGSERA
ncbi:AI-2E family transporter [Haloarchaeobius baliensis]|uniref:AI-2E family transporter n=1 Tax=Haloarchaeobius baliensis TaxID=1670458 RepID=UPI003F884E92